MQEPQNTQAGIKTKNKNKPDTLLPTAENQ